MLKDLKDEDELMGHIHETSTLSVDVDVKDDTDDVKHVPLPFSSTPVHSRSEPPEVLKPLSRYPLNGEQQGCSKCVWWLLLRICVNPQKMNFVFRFENVFPS